MTELPIVVNMTVDASRTEYDLTAESNLEEIGLLNDTVIETGGSHVPVYEGPYTVDAGLNAVTLDTDGKRMTQDVTVNALTDNYISGNNITVDSNGKVSSFVSVSAGYSPNVFAQMFYKQLDTQARATITPTTSEQTAVARGKYTTGVVKVRAIPSPYADVSGVTAQASDVLSGKYFVDSNGVLTLGTGTGGGMDTETKDALLECFEHVAWADSDGQIYYNNLLNALYPLQSISAVYTQSGNVYVDTPLDDLKADLVVTATFEDGTTKTVTNYTLSGTLAVGTSTVTVTYFTETTTFNVTVSASTYLYELPAPFTSDGTATINTNVRFEAGHTYTFLCDFTITTFVASNAVGFVFGNKVTKDSSAYLSLQTQLNAGSRYLWGVGIGWSNGKNIAVANNRNRIVIVCTINADSTVACSTKLKDITAGSAVKTFSNTYAAGAGTTANTYYLGKVPNGSNNESGFIGTINTFRIYNGEMSSADIDNFITNG